MKILLPVVCSALYKLLSCVKYSASSFWEKIKSNLIRAITYKKDFSGVAGVTLYIVD